MSCAVPMSPSLCARSPLVRSLHNPLRLWTFVRCLALLIFLAVPTRAARNVTITKMFFTNHGDSHTVTLFFSFPIIIDNIHIIENIEGDTSVSIAMVTDDIIIPADYAARKHRAMNTLDRSSKDYKNAQISTVEVDLSNVPFTEGPGYSVQVSILDGDNDIYSELFIYKEERLVHEQEGRTRWFANPWVWCSVAFIVLIVLLLGALVFS